MDSTTRCCCTRAQQASLTHTGAAIPAPVGGWRCGSLGGGRMVVRQCYVDLYADLAGQLNTRPAEGLHHGMILLGNPGIGMSCLLNYFLLLLLLEGRTVYLEREYKKPRGLLFMDGRATLHKVMPSYVAADRSAVHLFDPAEAARGTMPAEPYCVVTASPRRAHYEAVEKNIVVLGRKSLRWWMPCWDWREMEWLVRDGQWNGLGVDHLRELYRWHGGVPRAYQQLTDVRDAEVRVQHTAFESFHSLVQQAAGESFRSLVLSLVNMSAPAHDGSGVYALLQFTVADYAPLRSDADARPDYQVMEAEFLSPSAREVLEVHILHIRGDELWQLYRYVRWDQRRGGGTLAGVIYESFCHAEIPRWAAARLPWPSGMDDLPVETLPPPSRLVSVRAGVYYRGLVSYPGVDALVVCGEQWYAFQYTVRNRHDVHVGVLWQMLQVNPQRRGKWVHLVMVSNMAAAEYEVGAYQGAEHLAQVRQMVRLRFLRFHDEVETPVANPLGDLAWR